MISDVLFEAVNEIERYQRDFGHCYDDIRPEIEAVKRIMNQLRIKLDTPPPMYQNMKPVTDGQVGKAIQTIGLSGGVAVSKELLNAWISGMPPCGASV